MRKFTFIAEFRGGTYISQYKCNTLNEAVTQWSKGLSLEYFSKNIKKRIIEKTKEEEYRPLLLDSIDNTWCVSYYIYRSFLLLNIVETI